MFQHFVCHTQLLVPKAVFIGENIDIFSWIWKWLNFNPITSAFCSQVLWNQLEEHQNRRPSRISRLISWYYTDTDISTLIFLICIYQSKVCLVEGFHYRALPHSCGDLWGYFHALTLSCSSNCPRCNSSCSSEWHFFSGVWQDLWCCHNMSKTKVKCFQMTLYFLPAILQLLLTFSSVT